MAIRLVPLALACLPLPLPLSAPPRAAAEPAPRIVQAKQEAPGVYTFGEQMNIEPGMFSQFAVQFGNNHQDIIIQYRIAQIVANTHPEWGSTVAITLLDKLLAYNHHPTQEIIFG